MDERPLLLKNGTVITMDDAIGDLLTGDVLVRGNRIESVAPSVTRRRARRSSTRPG